MISIDEIVDTTLAFALLLLFVPSTRIQNSANVQQLSLHGSRRINISETLKSQFASNLHTLQMNVFALCVLRCARPDNAQIASVKLHIFKRNVFQSTGGERKVAADCD